MGSYKINHDISTKKVVSLLEGRFTEDNANSFVKDYNAIIRVINPSEYVLDLDCYTLIVATPHMAELLKQCFEMYREDDFKKILFRMNDVVVKMQFSRLARQAGLKNYEFID